MLPVYSTASQAMILLLYFDNLEMHVHVEFEDCTASEV